MAASRHCTKMKLNFNKQVACHRSVSTEGHVSCDYSQNIKCEFESLRQLCREKPRGSSSARCGLNSAFTFVFLWVETVKLLLPAERGKEKESSLIQIPYVMTSRGGCCHIRWLQVCFQWMCLLDNRWEKNWWSDLINAGDLDDSTCSPKHSTAVNNFETI